VHRRRGAELAAVGAVAGGLGERADSVGRRRTRARRPSWRAEVAAAAVFGDRHGHLLMAANLAAARGASAWDATVTMAHDAEGTGGGPDDASMAATNASMAVDVVPAFLDNNCAPCLALP
jgi:hypothetical protein